MNPLIITDADLIVSSVSQILELTGIMPSTKAEVKLTLMPVFQGIAIRPLYEVGEMVIISLVDFERIVYAAGVSSDDLFPVNLTVALTEAVRDRELDILECNAVTDSTDVHPNFKQTYTPVSIRVPRK